MRFPNMVLFVVPMLFTVGCAVGAAEDVESAAQKDVSMPATVETTTVEQGASYLRIRAGYCHSDGVVVRDGSLIRLGTDTGITDVTGITTFVDPTRNAGDRVCHNKKTWIKLAAYVCQANEQYVDPLAVDEAGTPLRGRYVGETVQDWQYSPSWVAQSSTDPLREYVDGMGNYIDHPDSDVTTGLNLGLAFLDATPCPTPSGADFTLERVECCMGAPRPVSP